MRFLGVISMFLIAFVGAIPVSHSQGSIRPQVEWHPSENLLAVSQGNSLQILDGSTLEIVNDLTDIEEEVYTFAWSNDGSKIVFSTLRNTYLWDKPTFSTNYSLMESPYPSTTEPQIVFPVSSLAWNASDEIIVGSIGGTLIYWNGDSFEVLDMFALDWSEINDIAWSSGNKIAIANRDSTVYVVDSEAQEIEKMYAISGEGISAFTALDFDSSGEKLAFGWDDGFVFVWNITQTTDYISRSGAVSFGVGMAHQKPVTSLDWSSNDLFIATGSQDGTAKIWNAETGELLQTIDIGPEWTSVSVSWSSDSAKLAYIADNMAMPMVIDAPR